MNQLTAPRNVKKQSAFHKLWQQAERHKRHNAQFEQDLEALVQRVQTEVYPVEREAAQADKPLLHILIKLAQRKTLAQWQRFELDDWIVELINQMQCYALVDQDLVDDLARYDAFRLGITLDDESNAAPSEQLADIINRKQKMQDDAVEEDGEAMQESADSDYEHEDFFDFDIDVEDDNFKTTPFDHPSESTVSIQLFQRLFRSTAAKLHPDREPDPAIRKNKQALMADLLRARKKGDVMTILALHAAYVDDQSDFSKQDEKLLIQALKNQINELKNEKENIVLRSPLHWMVYQNFYSQSEKKVDSAIDKHLQRVSLEKNQTEKMVKEIRTLKTLKPWLELRVQHLRRSFRGGRCAIS